MFDTPFIIPVVAIIAWAFVSAVRAKNGMPDPDWNCDGTNAHTPPLFKKMFEKEVEKRDEEIRSLKERIQVLEKIVTETHRKHSLSEEIDKLREGQ